MRVIDMKLFLVKRAIAGLAFAAPLFAAVSFANAQAMSPMRQIITSYADQFAVKVHPKNPYGHRIRMEIKVYDQDFKLTPARVSPKTMMMAAGATRPVTVIVPFDGKLEKKIRICAESIPFANRPTIVKAQVCGRFLARRAK